MVLVEAKRRFVRHLQTNHCKSIEPLSQYCLLVVLDASKLNSHAHSGCGKRHNSDRRKCLAVSSDSQLYIRSRWQRI